MPHCFDLHGNQGFTLILIRANPKGDVPRRWRQWIRHAVKKNCAAMAITLAQTKDEMFIVHYPRWCDRLDFARQEKRLRISTSKGLQHFVPAQKIDIDLRERELMVQSHARLKSFFGKTFTCNFAKSFCKEVEIFLAQCKTGRHFVSAEFAD